MDRKEIKAEARQLIKNNWGSLLLALALQSVILAVIASNSFGIGGLIVAGPLMFSVFYIYNEVLNGKKGEWTDIIKGFKANFGDSMLVGAVLSVIEAIPILCSIFLGAFLLIGMVGAAFLGGMSSGGGVTILLGIGYIIAALASVALTVLEIYLLLSYNMSMYILMREPEVNALSTIKKSKYMMNGFKKDLFMLYLSFVGWLLLSLLTFGILLIWVAPYIKMSETIFYRNVFEEVRVEDGIEKASEETGFCINCGAQLIDGAKFCGKCGTKQR